MGMLTQRTHDKLNSSMWRAIRDLFVQVSEIILAISSDAHGDLAGSYIRFATGPTSTSATYAAVWPRMSAPKRLIVGLTLPEDFKAESLGPPPERVFYQGLTEFLVIENGQAFPAGLAGWAKRAYEEALSSDGLQ